MKYSKHHIANCWTNESDKYKASNNLSLILHNVFNTKYTYYVIGNIILYITTLYLYLV